MMTNRQIVLACMSGLFALASIVPGSSSVAWGAIVQTDSSTVGSELAYSASADDLIDASEITTLSSAVHDDVVFDANHLASAFNNGVIGDSVVAPNNNGYIAAVRNEFGGVDIGGAEYGQWTSTYNLNLASAPLGYDIISVQTISGWPDNRTRQSYELLVSQVGNPGFVSLGTFVLDAPSAIESNSTRIVLTDSSGVIATKVDAVQFHFLFTGGIEAGYRELDVLGLPTAGVPEPCGASLFVLGLVGVARFARRKRS